MKKNQINQNDYQKVIEQYIIHYYIIVSMEYVYIYYR